MGQEQACPSASFKKQVMPEFQEFLLLQSSWSSSQGILTCQAGTRDFN
jgi:hypothetical protein